MCVGYMAPECSNFELSVKCSWCLKYVFSSRGRRELESRRVGIFRHIISFWRSFWQENVESNNAFTLPNHTVLEDMEWFCFLPISVAQERSLQFQTALEFELGTITHLGSHLFVLIYSSPLVSSEIFLDTLLKVFRSLRRKVMLRSERSVKPTAMFKTQCGSCVLSTPAAEVWAALCPLHCNWFAASYKYFKKIWLFFCRWCVCGSVSLYVLCVFKSLWRPKEGAEVQVESHHLIVGLSRSLQKPWGHWSAEPSPAPSTLFPSYLSPTFTSPSTNKEPVSSCFVLMIKNSNGYWQGLCIFIFSKVYSVLT